DHGSRYCLRCVRGEASVAEFAAPVSLDTHARLEPRGVANDIGAEQAPRGSYPSTLSIGATRWAGKAQADDTGLMELPAGTAGARGSCPGDEPAQDLAGT